MDNELKEKIADILKNCTTFTNESYDYADQILSLIAPVVEKAEKWDIYQQERALDDAEKDRFVKLMQADEDKLRDKARKWDRVKEWSTFDCDSNPKTCPLDIPDCFSHCSMEDVYNAIQGWYIKEDALEADKEAT